MQVPSVRPRVRDLMVQRSMRLQVGRPDVQALRPRHTFTARSSRCSVVWGPSVVFKRSLWCESCLQPGITKYPCVMWPLCVACMMKAMESGASPASWGTLGPLYRGTSSRRTSPRRKVDARRRGYPPLPVSRQLGLLAALTRARDHLRIFMEEHSWFRHEFVSRAGRLQA